MKKIVILLIIIDILLNVIVILNQNKKIDTGLHKVQECVMLNEEVYCKIAMVVENE